MLSEMRNLAYWTLYHAFFVGYISIGHDKGRHLLGHLEVYGMILFKLSLKKYGVKLLIGFKWLRIKTNGTLM
jgi:hypothetical protein